MHLLYKQCLVSLKSFERLQASEKQGSFFSPFFPKTAAVELWKDRKESHPKKIRSSRCHKLFFSKGVDKLKKVWKSCNCNFFFSPKKSFSFPEKFVTIQVFKKRVILGKSHWCNCTLSFPKTKGLFALFLSPQTWSLPHRIRMACFGTGVCAFVDVISTWKLHSTLAFP